MGSLAGGARVLRSSSTVRLPRLVPAPKPDSLEGVADEIAEWVASTGDAIADGLLQSNQAPFAAPASQRELGEYYGRTLFDERGLPLAPAWQAEFARVGARGLVEAVQGGAAWRREQGLPVFLPPPGGPAPTASAAPASPPGAPPVGPPVGGAAPLPGWPASPPGAPRPQEY